MTETTKLKLLATAMLAGLLLAAAQPALAGPDDSATAAAEMERARKEVEKAREELQRATRELARSMARVEKDNPRAQYFEFMTNPKRAVLGVIIDDESTADDRGVKVLAVTPGSGAEQGGLKAGDLLLSLDGKSLAAADGRRPERQLREVLRGLEAGDEVKLEYERDGKRSKAKIKTQAPELDLALSMIPPLPPKALLDMDESDFEQFMPYNKMFQFRGSAIRGLELSKLDDDLARYFKTKDGVLVVKAPKDKALGLKSGDVIQKIDGDAVSEPVTVMDKLRSRGSEQAVKIELMRQGKKQTLEAKIPVADARSLDKRKRVEVIIEDDEDDEDHHGK